MTWRGNETAPAPAPAHIGRHRRPRPLVVDEARIPTVYLNDVVRHIRDGLSIDDAMTLAGIDADDALTAWRTA